MSPATAQYPRGSEWRQWDLHVHSPASFFWKGQRFSESGSGKADIPLVDQMIEAFNSASPAVFALMDYWNFDGWFALKNRLSKPGAPQLQKKVFPGIELRLAAPMKGRLNAHVIFSDQIDDQHLRDFLSGLRLEVVDQPLSESALIAYARSVGGDKLRHHGHDRDEVAKDNAAALLAGYQIAEIKCDSYKSAIEKAPDGLAVGFMPFTTNDGLRQIDVMAHYAYVISLFRSSPIFEARDEDTWRAFVGTRTPGNADWFDAFQEALNGVPRLPVSGSDAHCFVGRPGDNDLRGYGDYPSGRITWIKSDPTWRGLLQAIKEPEKRCHIGATPPKAQHVANNKTFFIDRVSLAKANGSALTDRWFDGASIPLSYDLVAIIGNKGSGKSALADVVALAGDSQDSKHFSFLKVDRFRGKAGEPARQFTGRLEWHAGDPSERNLADDPSSGAVELVKYIPQGRFEALCNDHVSGHSDAFERELRAVIFSHVGQSRHGAMDFDQLIEAQERTYRDRLGELRKNLSVLNHEISLFEDQLHPDVHRNVEQQLRLKNVQLEEHIAAKPPVVEPPSDAPTAAQQEAVGRLSAIAAELSKLALDHQSAVDRQAAASTKKQAAKNVFDRLTLFEGLVTRLRVEMQEDLARSGIAIEDVVSVTIKKLPAETAVISAEAEAQRLGAEAQDLLTKRAALEAEASGASDKLNEPQQRYQAYLVALSQWQERLGVLNGKADVPDSREGLQARLAQLDKLPAALAVRREERLALSEEIFRVLVAQRESRSRLFGPIQDLIESNELIRVKYRLQFQANLSVLHGAISENVFSIVKQNVGDIRGEDESRSAIKERCDRCDPNTLDGALALVTSLYELLYESARRTQPDTLGLKAILRKDRLSTEIYDYVFGLDYLMPKYTLLFQDAPIEQLSPGQRGALLLIFYLLVDKGRNPIILDQPEENLDNETIVNLLVPVIREAKKHRQIIMVTHNPNLAVVCDAEQIIYAHFERCNGSAISYVSGAIEDERVNQLVVNVLEGTKPAFVNRSGKYH